MHFASFYKWIITIFTCASLLTGCGPGEPIKIGVVASLSGRRSQLGVSARNAVIMAVKEVNENGGIDGRTVELIVKDNKDDVAVCRKITDELADEGVVAIIGPVMSKMALVMIETIQDKDILIISPTVSTTAIENIDDNFLRLMPANSQEAETMARVVQEDGHKKLAVVYDASNKEYTLPIFEAFSEKIKKGGGRILYVNDMLGKNERLFTNMAKDIINSGAQALYIVSSGIDAAFLCQQIRKINQTIDLYGSHWVKSGNIIEQGGKNVEGMRVVAPFEKLQKRPEYRDFSDTHLKLFKAQPNFVAKYTYETAQVLFEGIRRSVSPISAQTIKTAILEIKTFEGLEETFTINAFGDATRSNTVFEIRNGAFQRRD